MSDFGATSKLIRSCSVGAPTDRSRHCLYSTGHAGQNEPLGLQRAIVDPSGDARGVVDFDPERRAAMVSNLLVVLCGESRRDR